MVPKVPLSSMGFQESLTHHSVLKAGVNTYHRCKCAKSNKRSCEISDTRIKSMEHFYMYLHMYLPGEKFISISTGADVEG